MGGALVVAGLALGVVALWLAAPPLGSRNARASVPPRYASSPLPALLDEPLAPAQPGVAEQSWLRRVRTADGTIATSLYRAAGAAGVPAPIVAEMAEVLGWEIDFTTDLRAGASFAVTWDEVVRRDGTDSVPGHVLAARVTNRGRTYEGFRYTSRDGHTRYYDRRGEALGRAFLRYPVTFSRISARFSHARFHPVLRRLLPHYGVDFAARRGTPVRAVADGRVVRAGWSGGSGRFVKISHGSVWASGYAHLSRIARGVARGAAVQKGQVIGYVGASGRATGPHLHFALYRNGSFVDPLAADLPRVEALAGSALASFVAAVERLDVAAGGDQGPAATQLTAMDVGCAPSPFALFDLSPRVCRPDPGSRPRPIASAHRGPGSVPCALAPQVWRRTG